MCGFSLKICSAFCLAWRFHFLHGRTVCTSSCSGAAAIQAADAAGQASDATADHGAGEGARPARGRDGDAQATWREKMWGPGCGV